MLNIRLSLFYIILSRIIFAVKSYETLIKKKFCYFKQYIAPFEINSSTDVVKNYFSFRRFFYNNNIDSRLISKKIHESVLVFRKSPLS